MYALSSRSLRPSKYRGTKEEALSSMSSTLFLYSSMEDFEAAYGAAYVDALRYYNSDCLLLGGGVGGIGGGRGYGGVQGGSSVIRGRRRKGIGRWLVSPPHP